MSELQDDVDELQSEEAGSEDVEVNRDLFKDEHGFPVAFFLHRSIKKSFSRRNLTRDIKVRHEFPPRLSTMGNLSFFCRDTAELYWTLILAAIQSLSMPCMTEGRLYRSRITLTTIVVSERSSLNWLLLSNIAFGITSSYTEYLH